MGNSKLSENDKRERTTKRIRGAFYISLAIAIIVSTALFVSLVVDCLKLQAQLNDELQDLRDQLEEANQELTPVNEPAQTPMTPKIFEEDYYFLERNISSNATIAITHNGSVLALINITLEYELLEIESKYDDKAGTYDFKIHVVNFYLNITITGPEFYGGVCVSIEELLYVTSGNDTMPTINEDMLLELLNVEPWGDYELE